MIYVIAILAKAGHGKTTVANHLRDTYGAKIVSLAGPLKRCAQKVMRFSDEQVFGPQEIKEAVDPRYGMSPREFLQRLGTEGLREEFGQDIHVQALIHEIKAHHDATDGAQEVYVVDDVRFPNEVSALTGSEDFRGAVIKVVCTDAPDSGDHASEVGIDKVYPEQIAATVVSSRAQGTSHLIGVFEHDALSVPALAPIQRALIRQMSARKAA